MINRLAATGGVAALVFMIAVPAQARPMSAEEAAQLREEVAALKATVERLEKRLTESVSSAADPAAKDDAVASTRVEWKDTPRVGCSAPNPASNRHQPRTRFGA